MVKYKELTKSIIKGDNVKSKEIAQKLVNKGINPTEILNDGLIPGMDIVGEKFSAGEYFIPEMLIAARAMHSAMDVIKPLLAESNTPSRGTVIIGTVQGDLHDIGKNLVAMMLEGKGFTVIDIGVDVSAEKFVEEAKKNNANIIGISALLTTTMTGMKEIIETFRADDKVKNVKIMIGGAPLTQEYADKIGADGYAPDAASATDLAADLLK